MDCIWIRQLREKPLSLRFEHRSGVFPVFSLSLTQQHWYVQDTQVLVKYCRYIIHVSFVHLFCSIYIYLTLLSHTEYYDMISLACFDETSAPRNTLRNPVACSIRTNALVSYNQCPIYST
jgi:hypothetical protein